MRLPSARLRPSAPTIALLCATALAAPQALAGQEGCVFGEGSGIYRRVAISGGGSISYAGTPHFVCEDGVQIWADSAVAYSELGMAHLMGSVRYIDRTRELRADTARYFSDQGRLQANGHVFVREDTDGGSRIENGSLVYLRRTDFRDTETMTVTTAPDGVRPRAVMRPAAPDSASPDAAPPEPYTIVGDRIFLRGDSYFTSSGDVEIERDSLFAFADSVEFDEALDHLVLDRNARVVTDGTELVGRVITIGSPGASSSRIQARREAVLTTDDVLLRSPEILVFLVDGTLERLVATPIAAAGEEVPDSADVVRPVATIEDFELTGDSLEVVAPAEVVERIVVVGRAQSISTSRDSLNVESLPDVARTDWLRGDTVTVVLKPAGDTAVVAEVPGSVLDTIAPPPVADTSEAGTAPTVPARRPYEVDRVVARGNASSLYRLVPSDSAAVVGTDPPALHYVVGSEITVTMAEGEVDHLQVVGQTRGVHLEPLTRLGVADTAAVPDTSSLARDTTVAPSPAQGGPIRPRRRAPAAPPSSPEGEPWRRS